MDFLHGPINNVGGNQFNYHITNNISGDLGLQRLNPVEMDASDRPECLLGTRVDIIESILNWASDVNGEHRVLWLHGLAGSGKSTLATTIANLFRKMGRLGAFVFFDRDVAERSRPAVVIRTTAYQLARNHCLTIGTAISAAIDRFPSVSESPIRLQFSKLLVEPLLSHTDDTPIVLIFDALDECGNRNDRRNLMAVLAEESACLPSALRLIITSRAEHDIQTAFASKPHILVRELDITTEANNTDIQSYFQDQMAIVRCTRPELPFPSDWPGNEIIGRLTELAFGLFIWASTAMDLIRNAHYPDKRLQALLKEGVALGAETAIDTLYQTALKDTGRWDDQYFVEDFRAVLGMVLVAKNPLSIQTIDLFLGIPSANTVSFLSCLVTQSPTVRVLHPSFGDFLLSSQRCQTEEWLINTASHNLRLAFACLDRLHATLERNICHLTFSATHWQVDASLNEDIAYACIYWIEHVCAVNDQATKMRECVDNFLVQHLLHWIEAMSILRRSREINKLLNSLHEWIDTHFPDQASDLVEDACRFVQAFIDPIADHPLSVYYSALPFTPIHTNLFRTFHDRLSFPTIVRGFETSWSPLLLVFLGHSSRIASAAFSRDGTRVACGSWPDISGEPTTRVWDLRSGVEVLSPLAADCDGVSSLDFSRDGALIVSGGRGGTVQVWDTVSGARVLGPLRGHTKPVSLVAFFPDGKRIVSISRETRGIFSDLRVWAVSSGIQLLQSNTNAIFAMEFSPDGTLIALTFGNSVIEVYDALSGQLVFGPLRPHGGDDGFNVDETFCVLWSPCGKRIITGSAFDRIFVWDVESSTEIISFIHQHDSYLSSLAISHDGTQLASASEDQSIIRVWNLTSRKEILSPLRGHKDTISALAFSPDSKQIISVSWDQTVRVWDVTSVMSDPPSHNFERALAFSDDGKLALSGSTGKIHVWDADSGTEMMHVNTRHLPPDIRFLDLAFAPDGQQIASSTSDKTVRMWNASSGEELFTKQLDDFDEISCILFSPDGMFIAVGVSVCIYIWYTSSGEQFHPPLTGHEDAVTCLVFSHDGSRIASGSSDKTIRVWDVVSGVVIFSPPPVHQNWVTSVAFSPSDKRIVSVSHFELCSWDATSCVCLSVVKMHIPIHRRHRIHNRIGITHEGGYVVDLQSNRTLSRLPPSIYTPDGTILYLVALAAHENAVAVGTRSGQSVIVHFPNAVLTGFDTRPYIVPNGSTETDDLLPIEIFNMFAHPREVPQDKGFRNEAPSICPSRL